MTGEFMIGWRSYATPLLLGLCLCLAGASAQAQDLGAGEHIARTWCSNCHSIEAKAPKGNDAVPSFVSIANMSSTTRTSLSVFLSTPHAGMPDYALSRAEIRDVSAYITSLRNPR